MIQRMLLDYLNNSVYSRIDILTLSLNILEYLESEKTSVYKTEYMRRKFYEKLLGETILNEKMLNRLGNDFTSINDEESESLIHIIFNLPNKVSNYLETCPQELKPDNFYISFYHSCGISNQYDNYEKIIILVNKMITSAQHKTLVQYWWNQILKETDLTDEALSKNTLLKLFSQYPSKIISYHKILREFLSFLSKISTHNFDLLSTIFLKLFEKIEYSDFIKQFLPKILADKNLSLNAVNFLIIIIDKYFKVGSNYEIYHQAVENALILWHDQNFIKKASNLHLKFLTNFIRLLIPKTQKEFFLRGEIVTFIQEGMSNRLSENFTSAFHRKCGEVNEVILVITKAVWTSFIRKMEIKEGIEIVEKEGLYDNLLVEEEVETKSLEEEKTNLPEFKSSNQNQEEDLKIKAEESDSDEEFITLQPQQNEENIFTLTKPKHLYDCLLGLRSDNFQRVEYSLKHVNYLIRKNLSDIEYIAEELALTLCKMNNVFDWDKFEEYRSRALISLSILIPDIVSNCLIKRFFHSECSLGEKLTLIEVLEKASNELSDNPAKYSPEQYNEYNDSQDFYFKPVSTKYFTEEEKHKEEIKKIQDEKIESKSRRWGETRRKREDEAIIPLKKKEILVINSDTQQIFINRFNSLCNHFFFPMIVPLRNKKKFLLKEPILLAKIISWISIYLKNAKNAPVFYNILEEALDFLLANIKSEDQAVLAQLFKCFFMLSSMLNKNIVVYYNNIVQKLLLLLKLTTELVTKNEKFKIIIYEISSNIQKLFEVDFPSN